MPYLGLNFFLLKIDILYQKESIFGGEKSLSTPLELVKSTKTYHKAADRLGQSEDSYSVFRNIEKFEKKNVLLVIQALGMLAAQFQNFGIFLQNRHIRKKAAVRQSPF